MDEPEVEFLVAPDEEPGDEELAQPQRRPPARNPLLIAGLVLVAAVATATGLKLANSSHRSADSAAGHPTPRPGTSSPYFPAPNEVVIGGPRRPIGDLPADPHDVAALSPRFCPDAGDGMPACTASDRVPAAVLAAITDRFPHTRTVRAFDEVVRDTGLGPGGLWYRELHVHAGRLRVLITVTRRPVATPEEVAQLPDFAVFGYGRGGLHVHTVAHGAPDAALPVRKLSALTDDPRLRAAG